MLLFLQVLDLSVDLSAASAADEWFLFAISLYGRHTVHYSAKLHYFFLQMLKPARSNVLLCSKNSGLPRTMIMIVNNFNESIYYDVPTVIHQVPLWIYEILKKTNAISKIYYGNAWCTMALFYMNRGGILHELWIVKFRI